MSKIVVFNLPYIDVGTLLHDLTPAQVATVWGGFPYFSISNITDSVYINSTGDTTFEGAGSFNIRDSKFNTIDYSRSNYNNFGVMNVSTGY